MINSTAFDYVNVLTKAADASYQREAILANNISDEFSKLHTVLCYNLQWFAQDGEGGEKTEPATEKKLKDAREEGKVAKSKELTAAFDLIVLFLVLKIFISFVGGNLIGLFSTVYKKMPDFLKESQEQISSVSVTHYLNNV